ncbi:MAG: hypothetical protein J0M00_07065 [Burkholderiales bacterium]|nr:hypothetical protein [Burkholderiales bacterium]
MATTSTKLDKARDDVKKLLAAETIERTRTPAVSKWLITEYQLDAQHIEMARKSNVVALTLEQFQRRFFDSSKYLSLRQKWAFGSARDPQTDSVSIADDAYISLPITVGSDSKSQASFRPGQTISLHQLVLRIIEGGTVVLKAPFGSGKSLTTREIFKHLAKMHRNDPGSPVPLTLNLRDHWGEDYSDEILERHARSIGYTPREDIVVAWRAGMCCLLLDGFDEVASQSVVKTDNKNFMRDARRRALKGVRDFTQKAPAGAGIFVCGRDHYFDNDAEMSASIGTGLRPCLIVNLEEFSDAHANEFLRKNGLTPPLPDWLPRKPLILAYLIRQGLYSEILAIDSSQGFGHAWDQFLTRICERESQLESSSMDPVTIRTVLERLAESVRSKTSGTGPVTGVDLAEAYFAETGQAAGEGVLAQLQRLPGLTQRDNEPGNRSFVDFDMLGALQGSAFARRVLAAFQGLLPIPLAELSDRAVSMATHILSTSGATPETLVGVAEQLGARATRDSAGAQLLADCVSVAVRMAIDMEREEIDFRGLSVNGGTFGRLPLDEIRIKRVSLANSIVHELALGSLDGAEGVRFSNCLISRVCGVAARAGLPSGLVDDETEIDAFDSLATNNAVLKSDLPANLKALVTVLRKLYRQPGSGRKISAFSRGITKPEVARLVEPVLGLLQQHRFVTVFSSVVHPVRKQSPRVDKILLAPSLSDDELVRAVRALA